MEYAELTDDELRLEVAKRCGWTELISVDKRDWIGLPPGVIYGYSQDLPYYPRDLTAAIALLEDMTYPDGVSVEYVILKETYNHIDDISPLPAPVYFVQILARNPVSGKDYETTADTLPRAACLAWLAWRDAQL